MKDYKPIEVGFKLWVINPNTPVLSDNRILLINKFLKIPASCKSPNAIISSTPCIEVTCIDFNLIPGGSKHSFFLILFIIDYELTDYYLILIYFSFIIN